MEETFYAVQYIINDRAGTLPSKFSSKDDAISYAKKLNNLETDGVKTEVRLYEVKKIPFN